MCTYLSLLFSKKPKYYKKITLPVFLLYRLIGVEYAGRDQPVVNPLAAFVISDNSGIFQNGQMLAHCCEFHADSVDKFADTMFRPISELLDDPQPDGVSQSFENLCFFFKAIFFVDKHNTPRYPVNIT